MEALILVGIQAVGKSSFYQQRFFATHVRISLDLLRTRHRERSLLEWCLAHGQPFVVDNTNPTVAERAAYIAPARAAGFRVVGYYFESNEPASIRRNAARSGSACVPAAAIGGTKRRLALPTLADGFGSGGAILRTMGIHNLLLREQAQVIFSRQCLPVGTKLLGRHPQPLQKL